MTNFHLQLATSDSETMICQSQMTGFHLQADFSIRRPGMIIKRQTISNFYRLSQTSIADSHVDTDVLAPL